MVEISTLYQHLNTLTKQWFYDKGEVDLLLADKLEEADLPDVSDVIRTSSTEGLVKNNGTIDTTTYLEDERGTGEEYLIVDDDETGFIKLTNGVVSYDTSTYLTEHQDISGKEDSSNKSTSITTDTGSSTKYPTVKAVEDYAQPLGDYIETSSTTGLVKNDGTIDTNTYLTTTDASSTYVAKENGKGLFSGSYTDLTNIPETFAPGTHTHTVSDITDFSASASEVTDSNAHTNLGTSANATQSAINTAIDTKIGSLLSVELIEVVTTLPTASADTMNALYLVAEATAQTNDAYEIFVTVETADDTDPQDIQYSYAWEKVDTARIDLSGYASSTHTHGNLTNDGKIGSNADYFVYTTTAGAVTSKEKIGNISTGGAIGTDSGKVVTTTTNGVLTTSSWIDEIDTIVQALNTYGASQNNNSGGE